MPNTPYSFVIIAFGIAFYDMFFNGALWGWLAVLFIAIYDGIIYHDVLMWQISKKLFPRQYPEDKPTANTN